MSIDRKELKKNKIHLMFITCIQVILWSQETKKIEGANVLASVARAV